MEPEGSSPHSHQPNGCSYPEPHCPAQSLPPYAMKINLLTPNVNYSGRTAPLNSKVPFYIFIQQIHVPNILNMVYTLRFFSLQNTVCFIILMYLVPVLFTFYVQGVLKLKKNNSGAKRFMKTTKNRGHFGQPCCSFVHV